MSRLIRIDIEESWRGAKYELSLGGESLVLVRLRHAAEEYSYILWRSENEYDVGMVHPLTLIFAMSIKADTL